MIRRDDFRKLQSEIELAIVYTKLFFEEIFNLLLWSVAINNISNNAEK